MRVIAGSLGGRTIHAPKTKGTRPMGHKVREALFSILGSVEGQSALDAYAGSGALGIEALSRGASSVVAIEAARPAAEAIKKTIRELGLESQYELQARTVESWLAQPGDSKFDLIFVLPPYEQMQDVTLFDKFAQCLKSGGVMVVEYPQMQDPFQVIGTELALSRRYGDVSLAFYKRA